MNAPKNTKAPTNNFHCFKGKEGEFWMWKAMGRQPVRPKSGTFGKRISLKDDIDGFAIANGGIASPRERTLGVNREFFRAINSSRYDSSSGGFTPGGGWWLDADGFEMVIRTAEGSGKTFQESLKHLLCIPDSWGDCGFIINARLTKPMKAWTGAGSPAAGSVSPDILLDKQHRDKIASDEQFVLGRLDLKIQQIYVPGDHTLIASAFKLTTPPVRTIGANTVPFKEMLTKARLREEAIF